MKLLTQKRKQSNPYRLKGPVCLTTIGRVSKCSPKPGEIGRVPDFKVLVHPMPCLLFDFGKDKRPAPETVFNVAGKIGFDLFKTCVSMRGPQIHFTAKFTHPKFNVLAIQEQ